PSQIRTISSSFVVNATATRGSPSVGDPAAAGYRSPSLGLDATSIVDAAPDSRSAPPEEENAARVIPLRVATHTTATSSPVMPTSGRPAKPSREPSEREVVVATVPFDHVAPRSGVSAIRISPESAFVHTAATEPSETAIRG